MENGCVWIHMPEFVGEGIWYYTGRNDPCRCTPSPCTCECVDPYLHCGTPTANGQQCVTYCALANP